jgi:hypothetical protein
MNAVAASGLCGTALIGFGNLYLFFKTFQYRPARSFAILTCSFKENDREI